MSQECPLGLNEEPTNPPSDCSFCPRLSEFLSVWRHREPTWFNAPVPNFLPPEGASSVHLLIVGLAPGLRGANRTGRPFTGDFAGNLLYETLLKCNLAKGRFEAHSKDSLRLIKTAITNAVRCVPPENKPTGSEIKNCQTFLASSLASFPNLRIILTLGLVAYKSTLKALGASVSSLPFQHGKHCRIGAIEVFSSYHCSRYNTNTGVLTQESFTHIVSQIYERIQTYS